MTQRKVLHSDYESTYSFRGWNKFFFLYTKNILAALGVCCSMQALCFAARGLSLWPRALEYTGSVAYVCSLVTGQDGFLEEF